jgi:hypothetical protein
MCRMAIGFAHGATNMWTARYGSSPKTQSGIANGDLLEASDRLAFETACSRRAQWLVFVTWDNKP